MDLPREFERQIKNLLQKDYPTAAGISEEEFMQYLEPLRKKGNKAATLETDVEKGRLPFVIVVKNSVIPSEKAMSLVERGGKRGVTKLFPHEPDDFKPIGEVAIPDSAAYLLVDIDRGKDNINLPPHEALQIIQNTNRSPLTIDEGVAIVTQFPEFLIKNNCFSLLASRHAGDKRVPAIWITAAKNPNLGWCWEGNPHAWLGSASCRARVAAH